MSIFSDNLKRIRLLRELTQSELAALIGVSEKTISSWEVGRTEPNMGQVERICIVLNCNKSNLLDSNGITLTQSYGGCGMVNPASYSYVSQIPQSRVEERSDDGVDHNELIKTIKRCAKNLDVDEIASTIEYLKFLIDYKTGD